MQDDNQQDQIGLPQLPPLPPLPDLPSTSTTTMATPDSIQDEDNSSHPSTPLTDPVMPEEYSSTPAPTPEPTPTSTYQPLNSPTPAPQPTITPTTPPRTPATMPTSSSKSSNSSTIVIIFLLLISISSIAGIGLMYSQNQSLKSQVSQYMNSKEEITAEPTPAEETAEEATMSATPTATPSATITPTTSSSFSSFSNLNAILDLARTESSTAQLLMISSEDIKASAPTFKYWFRRGPSTKTYFFVQQQQGSDPKLFSSANITPDNNIPDLITYFTTNQLGLTASQATEFAWSSIKASLNNIEPTTIAAKYIRSQSSNPQVTSPLNLWQLTYHFSNHADVVLQIDAVNSKVVFNSMQK